MIHKDNDGADKESFDEFRYKILEFAWRANSYCQINNQNFALGGIMINHVYLFLVPKEPESSDTGPAACPLMVVGLIILF